MKQPRDKFGRFLSFEGTRPPKKLYTVEDIKEAFMAGLASQGGIILPSRKLDHYLTKKGLKL
jgi:hypothetical protein